MPQKLYYEAPNSSMRDMMIQRAIQGVADGLKVYFILPSREKMFQVRRQIMKEMGGLSGIEVIGFVDLYEKICGHPEMMSPLYETFILKDILSELATDNAFYKVREKKGFLELLEGTVTQAGLMQVDLDSLLGQDVPQNSSEVDTSLKTKLGDFGHILKAYEARKSELKLMSFSDLAKQAKSKISDFISRDPDVLFLIDGFMNMDEGDLQFLEALFNAPFDVQLQINVPYLDADSESDVVGILIHRLVQMGVELCPGVPLEAVRASQVGLYNSPCLDHEVRTAAKKIRTILLEQHIPAEDICVLVPNINTYEATLTKVFEEYGIPLRLQVKKRVVDYPEIREVLIGWQEGLTQHYSTDAIINEATYLELISDLMALLEAQKTKIQKCGSALTDGQLIRIKGIESLYAFLESLLAYRQIRESQKAIPTGALPESSDTLTFEVLMKSLHESFEMLQVKSFSRHTGGVSLMIPDLVRNLTFHSVFLLGLNEGDFPNSAGTRTIFNTFEMKVLDQMGLHFRTQAFERDREWCRFKSVLASASENLMISYRTTDEDGGLMIASAYVKEFLELAQHKSWSNDSLATTTMRERLSHSGMSHSRREAYLQWLVSAKNSVSTALTSGLDLDPYPLEAGRIEYIREYGATYSAYDGLVDSALFDGTDAKPFSASGIENYYECPFKYMSDRIWNLRQMDENMQIHVDIGSLYHHVLSRYFAEVKNPEVYDEALLTQWIDVSFESMENPRIPDVFREEYVLGLKDALKQFVAYESDCLAHYNNATGCHLVPSLFEHPFKIKTKEGIAFVGKIDRIDFEKTETGAYTGRYAIVDYKKGSKIKEVKDCICGSDHQLSIYYDGVQEMLREKLEGNKPECLGLFYQSISKCDKNGFVLAAHKKAFFKGAKGTKSVLGKENMDVILDWARDQRLQMIGKMQAGVYTVPQKCPVADSYNRSCGNEFLCRYEMNRLATKGCHYE